jgi:hypothetical protein
VLTPFCSSVSLSPGMSVPPVSCEVQACPLIKASSLQWSSWRGCVGRALCWSAFTPSRNLLSKQNRSWENCYCSLQLNRLQLATPELMQSVVG